MAKPKIAWGITGAGDKIEETVQVMMELKDKYEEQIDIEVFVSKAGDQVIKYYEISHEIETRFDKVWVEINANSPFLAGNIQLGKYKFMLVAPGTSNTVAKIALRMGDTLISNAAIMGQKADIPLYILPADYEEGIIITKLPDGKDLKLTIREEDVEHVRKLAKMNKTYILKDSNDLKSLFKEQFG